MYGEKHSVSNTGKSWSPCGCDGLDDDISLTEEDLEDSCISEEEKESANGKVSQARTIWLQFMTS